MQVRLDPHATVFECRSDDLSKHLELRNGLVGQNMLCASAAFHAVRTFTLKSSTQRAEYEGNYISHSSVSLDVFDDDEEDVAGVEALVLQFKLTHFDPATMTQMSVITVEADEDTEDLNKLFNTANKHNLTPELTGSMFVGKRKFKEFRVYCPRALQSTFEAELLA